MSDESSLENDVKELKLLLPHYRGSFAHNKSMTSLLLFFINLIQILVYFKYFYQSDIYQNGRSGLWFKTPSDYRF